MKVGLFEDRVGRMKQFLSFDLTQKSVVEIITDVELQSLISEVNQGYIERLKLYNCIIMHRSAFTNGQRDIIKKYCSDTDTPLVSFSGGISSSIYNDSDFPYLHINSKDVYSHNLQLFIEEMERHKLINLLILQFGTRWKLNLLLSMRNNLNRGLQSQNIKRIRDLKIYDLIRSEITEKFSLAWLNQNDFTPIDSTQVGEFQAKIEDLIVDSI